MKRVIAWVLILTLCLGLFAGCKKNKEDQNPTTGEATGNVADLEAALEYIKTVYRKPNEKTPKDFQRIGVVPVNGKEYEVVWSADVGDEYIKIVKGTDGMVTIDVNENVEAEVKYVLTATISDDAGNSVSHSWNHLLPVANGDMVAIVEEAYKLQPGEAMDYEVTLTGKITAINTPWDAGYKNITVTIVVEGAEDKPIMCYRLKGDGADKLKPNDIITVTGIIKNYNGTIEFDAGCTLDAVIEGEEIKAPTDPKQIIKEAYALAEGGALPYQATLTGVITKVNTEYSPQYKNVTVTMVVGGDKAHPIQCYRLAGDGADKIGEGDTITVTGWIVNYKGSVQFNQGCTLDKWSNTGADVPKPEDTFTTTLVPEVVTEPQVGVAYKFFMYQKSYGKNFYLTGKMDGFYYETTYDPAKAVDVYVEEVSGGYRLYFLDNGTKTYMEIVRALGTDGKMHNNVVFTTTPSAVLKWNAAIKSFTCELEIDGQKKDYYWGTYSFYKTFSGSDVSRITGSDADKMDTENFVGRLATMKETSITPAEKAYEQLKNDYPTASGVENTTEDYTRKNVYDVDGTKIAVEWTENGEAVTIVDNGDGTVTVKVTRGEADAPYTLTATITDGDKKYTASWQYKVPAVPPTGDMAIVDAAYALETDTSMADEVTLTGAITYIDTPYDSNYQNITVTIAVARREYKSIMCYRMKGEGADTLEVGDTITVTGKIKNYGGIIEFDSGCTLDNVVKGNGPAFTAPATQAEVLAEALTLEPMTSLPYVAELTGVIVDAGAYDASYGNITLHIQIGDTDIECYRMTGEGADALAIGDTITVSGMLTNVEGNLRMKAGCQLVDVAAVVTADRIAGMLMEEYAEGFENGTALVSTYTFENVEFTVTWALTPNDSAAVAIEEGKLVLVPQDEAVAYTLTATVANGDDQAEAVFECEVPAASTQLYIPKPVENAELGVAYKYFLHQANLGKDLFFAGAVNSNGYLETTENVNDATDVYLEAVEGEEGAVRIYFLDGETKQYVEIFKNSSNKVRHQIVAEPTMYYTYDTDAKTYVADIDGTKYYAGTYNTFNTISASKTSYITGNNAGNVGVSQFVAQFAELAPAAEDIETAVPPVEFETAYKYFLYQANLEQALYFVGTVNSNGYLEMSDDMNAAVDVYVEDASAVAENAVRIYILDGETKQYVEIFKNSSNKVRHQIVAEPTMYYTYDTDAKTYVADIDGTKYYAGTYNTFNTISASKTSYITGNNAGNVGVSQFVAQFGSVVVKEIAPVVVETPVAGTPYIYYLHQANLGSNLYFVGTVNSNGYLETSTDILEAAAIYTETVDGVDGAIRAYVLDGETKQYVEIFKNSSNKIRHQIVAEPTMYYTYDTDAKTYVADIDGTKYYAGTYNTFNTISASKTSYITGNNAGNVGVSQFVAYYAEIGFVEDNVEEEPEPTPTPTPTPDGATYTKIDRIANLTAGTYKMAAYCEAYSNNSTNNDWTANPYHVFTGVSTGSATENTDCYTSPYAFADGALTKANSSDYDAINIELVAVEGKENTYYLKSGDKYLVSNPDQGVTSRRLILSDTAAEWVAEDFANGGIVLNQVIGEGFVTLGSAAAGSKIIRSYRSVEGAVNTSIKYGLYFFAENTAE